MINETLISIAEMILASRGFPVMGLKAASTSMGYIFVQYGDTEEESLCLDFKVGNFTIARHFYLPPMKAFYDRVQKILAKIQNLGFEQRIARFPLRDGGFSYILEVVIWRQGQEEAIVTYDLGPLETNIKMLEDGGEIARGGVVLALIETDEHTYDLKPYIYQREELHFFLAEQARLVREMGSTYSPVVPSIERVDPVGVVRIFQNSKLTWVFVPGGLTTQQIYRLISNLEVYLCAVSISIAEDDLKALR